MNTSNCCGAKLNTICADEGTCHYECSKCGDACDIALVNEEPHEDYCPCPKCPPVSEQIEEEPKSASINENNVHDIIKQLKDVFTPQKEKCVFESDGEHHSCISACGGVVENCRKCHRDICSNPKCPLGKYPIPHSSTLKDEVTRLPLENDWEIAFNKEFDSHNKVVVTIEFLLGSNEQVYAGKKLKSFIRHQKELSFKEGARIERERIINKIQVTRINEGLESSQYVAVLKDREHLLVNLTS